MNKVILIGHISTDLELKQTNNGKSVVNFNLAINRFGEGTDFIPVQLWGIQADNLVQYQSKGSQIAIEGTIRIDTYNDSDGKVKYKTYVLAQNIKFLDKKTSKQSNAETKQTDLDDFVDIDNNFLD